MAAVDSVKSRKKEPKQDVPAKRAVQYDDPVELVQVKQARDMYGLSKDSGIHDQLLRLCQEVDFDSGCLTDDFASKLDIDLSEHLHPSHLLDPTEMILAPQNRWVNVERFTEAVDATMERCIVAEEVQRAMLGYTEDTSLNLASAMITVLGNSTSPAIMEVLTTGREAIANMAYSQKRLAAAASVRPDNNSAKRPTEDMDSDWNGFAPALNLEAASLIHAIAMRARILYVEGLVSYSTCMNINYAVTVFVRASWTLDFSKDHLSKPIYAMGMASGALRLAHNCLTMIDSDLVKCMHHNHGDAESFLAKQEMVSA